MSSFSERQWMMPEEPTPTRPALRLVRDEPPISPDAPARTGTCDPDPTTADDMAVAEQAVADELADAGLAAADRLPDEADPRGGLSPLKLTFERRTARRFALESLGVSIDRWDGRRDGKIVFGKVMDLSAGGVRLRTRQPGVRPDQQIRVRLELPDNGGISPFVDCSTGDPRGKREWIGWLAVTRVSKVQEGLYDVAGRLVDMEEMDRGMLGLYLSTQPLAAA